MNPAANLESWFQGPKCDQFTILTKFSLSTAYLYIVCTLESLLDIHQIYSSGPLN